MRTLPLVAAALLAAACASHDTKAPESAASNDNGNGHGHAYGRLKQSVNDHD